MRTKTQAAWTIVLGLVGCSAAQAQPPGSSAVDFTGIYEPAPFVGTPEVTQPAEYPFTAQGRHAFETFDPTVAPRHADDCAAETMPGILWSGNTMQIIQQDGSIEIRFERGNTVRTIHMDGRPPPADQPESELGYSVGSWEGGVLRIDTTHVMPGAIFNNTGYGISAGARLTERYWREPGENDLQLEVVVDDPVNYTQPFTLGRDWVWAPHEQLREWVCVDLGPRDEEPDLDELTRILEQL